MPCVHGVIIGGLNWKERKSVHAFALLHLADRATLKLSPENNYDVQMMGGGFTVSGAAISEALNAIVSQTHLALHTNYCMSQQPN